MSIIHKTTLAPSKLELLTAWLPSQPWYLDAGRPPRLEKAGGFRLDDPAGAVGIEFMLVTDAAGDVPVTYHVPLTYRAAARPDAGDGLVGTTEHGVLGTRFVYDGTGDPVLVTELVGLIQGDTRAQAQSLSDTPDPTVRGHPVVSGAGLLVTGFAVATNDADGTGLRVRTTRATDGQTVDLSLLVRRVLETDTPSGPTTGYVQIPCRPANGTETHPVVVLATPAGESAA